MSINSRFQILEYLFTDFLEDVKNGDKKLVYVKDEIINDKRHEVYESRIGDNTITFYATINEDCKEDGYIVITPICGNEQNKIVFSKKCFIRYNNKTYYTPTLFKELFRYVDGKYYENYEESIEKYIETERTLKKIKRNKINND